MKKVVLFHPAIAPYRIDFFNSLQEAFDVSFYFLHKDALEQSFNQKKLKDKLRFTPHYLKPGAFGINNLRLDIFSVLRKEKPDAVFCSEYNLLGLLILLYKWFFNRKLIIVNICDDNLDKATRVSSVKKSIRRFSIRHFDGVILTNREVIAWYEKTFHSSVRLLYFPIIQDDVLFRESLSRALPKTESYCREYQLEGKQVILFVGRLVPLKNIPLLLKAFREVSGKHDNARLVLVGDGEERISLEQEVEALGLQEKVIFTGKKEGEDLYAMYNLGQVFVLASNDELFGAVINEALLAGCYTLCSSIAGATTLIQEGENGMVFNPYSETELIEKLEKAVSNTLPQQEVGLKPNQMSQSYAHYMENLIHSLKNL